jgi:diguanylate cyclase (GGDEF)-like protein
LYLDLDNFKGYNDYYGHSRGDEVIKLLANIIVDIVAKRGSHVDYVGHIGGDDFTVVCAAEPAKEISDEIAAEFEARVSSLFAPEDLGRGYFVTVDRQGKTTQQPCRIHVTIAAVPNDDNQYSSYVAMVDVATELKKYGKTKEGSVVVFDRRRT